MSSQQLPLPAQDLHKHNLVYMEQDSLWLLGEWEFIFFKGVVPDLVNGAPEDGLIRNYTRWVIFFLDGLFLKGVSMQLGGGLVVKSGSERNLEEDWG